MISYKAIKRRVSITIVSRLKALYPAHMLQDESQTRSLAQAASVLMK
jgi:hypothetical protein